MTSAGKGPKLIAIGGLAAGQIFDLHGEEIVVGRDPTNHIAIGTTELLVRLDTVPEREPAFQTVLSPATYLSSSPGATKNDGRILPPGL